jgi:HD-like signal output (HDOD) protein
MSLPDDLRTLDVDLPACPRVLLDLLVLLEDDDARLDTMAELIESDMALASAVVRTVNSAMFGLLRRVETVGEAVRYLGTTEVAALTFSTALRAAFPPTPQLDLLWHQSTRCGLLMGRSAPSLALDVWRAHTAGLFARSGQAVLLARSGAVYQPLLAQHGDDLPSLLAAEREAFGVTHAAYSSALCASWGLAGDIVKFMQARVEPQDRWQSFPAPLRDLLVLGSLVDELVAGEDVAVAAQRLASNTARSADELIAAVDLPWQRLSAADTAH